MRFLLFNAVVGLALVYLFQGGSLSLDGVKAAVQETAQMAAAKIERQVQVADAPKPQPKPQPKRQPKPAAEPDGHARDVIPAPKPAPPAPRRQSETPPPPPPVPGAKLAEAKDGDDTTVGPLPLPEPQEVAARPVHTADEQKAVDASVAARRDAVLGQGPANGRVALKEGTQMMSASERRRQLDALAEEMEMLYLEKVGG